MANQNEALQMAQYILQLLKGNNVWAFFAWGAERYQVINHNGTTGLRFKVNGAVFKGWIRVEYNNATDYFDVTFEKGGKVNTWGTEKEKIEDVDFASLHGIIDVKVEGNW